MTPKTASDGTMDWPILMDRVEDFAEVPVNAAMRKRDADATKEEILRVARHEFAENGLSGARIEAIAAQTKTHRKMLYYYFGSKEGLYIAVLEQAYAELRSAERALDLEGLSPMDALKRLVEFWFDYHDENRDFIRLVSVENIHYAAHISKSPIIRDSNSTVIPILEKVLRQGRDNGVFRPGLSALDLHLLVAGFCFIRVSNRYTFELLFNCSLTEPHTRDRHRELLVETIINQVRV